MKVANTEPRTGGKADRRDGEKTTRLTTFAFAPRYVKFFNAFFPADEDEDHDPLELIEGDVAQWINDGLDQSIGYEILQALPQATKDEVIVTVLYRKFALY